MPAEGHKKPFERNGNDNSLIDKILRYIPHSPEQRRLRSLQHTLFHSAVNYLEEQFSSDDEEISLLLPDTTLGLRITYSIPRSLLEFSWEEVEEGTIEVFEIKDQGKKIITGTTERSVIRLTKDNALHFTTRYDFSTENGVERDEYELSQEMRQLDLQTTENLIRMISIFKNQRQNESISL